MTESKNIPKHWQIKRLEDLLSYVIGGDWGKDVTFPDESYDLAYCIRGSEIKNWEENKGNTAALRKVKKSNIIKRQLIAGDILVEISGGGPEQPVGRTVLIDQSVLLYKPEISKICTNFLRLLRPDGSIDSRFLNLFLKFFYFSGEIIKYQAGSNNLRNLKFQDYLRIYIPIPPLPEQLAIVSKIEELFSELDNGKQQLLAAQQQLKVYRQSLLKAAFEGKLTATWRNIQKQKANEGLAVAAEPETKYGNNGGLPEGWEIKNLKSICKITGGVTKGKDYKGKQTVFLPYLRVANVQDGFLNLTVIKEIEVLPTDLEKYRLLHGDVLYTEGGDKDKLGRGTIWKNEIENCIHQNHIFRARPDSRFIASKFLSYFSQTKLAKDYFYSHGKQTTNLASINLTILSNLPVSIPPIDEQIIIVDELESKLTVCDKIEETIAQSLQQADTLRQSILKKAFEGKLV